MKWSTRARHAVVFVAALCVLAAAVVAGAMALAPQVSAAPGFSDIKGSEWYAEAALALEAEGIISPRADGMFGAYDPVTRAEMTVYLDRVLDLQASIALPFTDVGRYDWFTAAVGHLYAAGLVSGTSATTFSPDAVVNRQQATSLLMRALKYYLAAKQTAGYSVPAGNTQIWLNGFRDRGLIASQHTAAIADACRLGIVQGDAQGWFYPAMTLNRSQVAVMIYRAFMKPLRARCVPPLEVTASTAYPEQTVGSENTFVRVLEARLADLRYPCGDVDGVYDARTRDAVMAFEKVERLPRDGIAGPEVWERVFAAETPQPRLSTPGHRVEVDLTRQVLFMITDDAVTEVVHVSTGKLGTPTGHGSIWLRQVGWQHVPVGWMYYPAYFMPHIAIHGSKSVPPYPASHGCVRTPTWLSAHIYEQLPMGLGVDVYY